MNDWVIVMIKLDYDITIRKGKNLIFMIYGNKIQNILRSHINNVKI